MIRWSDGQMVRWSDGQVVRWSGGQMIRWSDCQMVRWSVGQMVRWSNLSEHFKFNFIFRWAGRANVSGKSLKDQESYKTLTKQK